MHLGSQALARFEQRQSWHGVGQADARLSSIVTWSCNRDRRHGESYQ
jgi:hypothetical protein